MFQLLGWTLVSMPDGLKAVNAFVAGKLAGFQAIFVELHSPVVDAHTFAKILHRLKCTIPIFVLADKSSECLMVPGAMGVVQKPLLLHHVVPVLLRGMKGEIQRGEISLSKR